MTKSSQIFQVFASVTFLGLFSPSVVAQAPMAKPPVAEKAEGPVVGLSEKDAAQDARVSLSGSYRLRYESLSNSFRTGTGADHLAVSRLLTQLDYHGAHWIGGAELLDARAWEADSGTPLGTDDVNTLTPLQVYLGWRGQKFGGELEVKGGRLTEDLGSRRLLARNRFRNTLNHFDGVTSHWRSPTASGVNTHWQAFWFNPVQRTPSARSLLDDNSHGDDRVLHGTDFWGIYRKREQVGQSAGLYLMRLDESDQSGVATRDRALTTLGVHLVSVPSPGNWGYELETAWQSGHSKASTAADAPRLEHRAGFFHGEGRYRFDDAMQSQLKLQLDYASGGRSDVRGENHRFDTLYGARRFDFGPTGIYGPFGRNNILSPGVKWQFRNKSLLLGRELQGFLGYRAFWLASDGDAHPSAGIDGSNGDRFAGHQLEARLRLPVGKMLQSEFGVALLHQGDAFAENDVDSVPTGYFYSQVTLAF